MLYPRQWRLTSRLLLGASFALHLLCFALYVRLPDRFAAFTTFPIWVWGSVGLGAAALAFLLSKARFSLPLFLIWCLTILFLSDETQTLGMSHREPLEAGVPEAYQGRSVLRVATLNCAGQARFDQILSSYQPDIVFLQEIPHSYLLKKFTDELYDGQGDYRYDEHKRCAVLVRGTLTKEIQAPLYRSQHLTATLPNRRQIQLTNLHLQPATTNLRLWKRDCWREHRNNRLLRQFELNYALEILDQKTNSPATPTIIAGDFNAPANDAVYDLLKRNQWTDAFAAAGTGWGNTFHRAAPLLRIDHIYTTPQLTPVRSRVISVPDSDHRLLLADFLLK